MMYRFFLLSFFLLLISGCTTTTNFKEPLVTIKKIELVSSESARHVIPEFKVTLNVANPNDFNLELSGLRYQISLNNEKVISGVDRELPMIPAYGENTIIVTARPDLFSGMSLFKSLMTNQYRSLNYQIDVEIDPGKLYPNISLQKQGAISSIFGG